MSLRKKVLAAAATLTLAGGLAATSALSAGAATPSCGPTCIDVFSKDFGTFHNPQFVMDVWRQGAKLGQPVILFRQSNSDPAEDFTISFQGQVSDFLTANMVSPSLALHYGCGWSLAEAKCTNGFPDDFAFEVEYAPFGVGSGLCVGVASRAAAGTKVSLQACGAGPDTVWVADTVDSCPSNPLYFAEVPAINASTVNFSHPAVLTYPASGYPTDIPRPQLTTRLLTGFSQSGGPGPCGTGSINGPASNQLWSAKLGVLH